MAYSTSDIENIISQVANELGVPVPLAIAVANQESGLNPTAQGDYNAMGQPTSFGLFQLHQGGELGNLTPQQAFDPTVNANVALSEFRDVMQKNPSITDPGTIAALAQRPADPQAYAQAIDASLGVATNNGTPFGKFWQDWKDGNLGAIAGDVAGGVQKPTLGSAAGIFGIGPAQTNYMAFLIFGLGITLAALFLLKE